MQYFLIILLSLSALIETAVAEETLSNRLRPFTSDGCSSFPDGFPYFDPEKWQMCCVQHDVAYWQGGTWAQRLQADKELQMCVSETGENVIGAAMYLGVRLGGHVDLPTSWHWGYGWIINRGYRALNLSEMQQVKFHLDKFSDNLEDIEIISAGIIPTRGSITGNYCKDMAIQLMAEDLGENFQIEFENSSPIQEKASGWEKTLLLKPTHCKEPYLFKFLLLKPDACENPTNELLVRGRVRLLDIQAPPICFGR